MSVVTATLLRQPAHFPLLLPKPPQPHPVPVPRRRVYEHLNAVRDLQREMDDLSDEENELEDITSAIRNRGYTHLIPIGRSLTQQEEKNDAEEDTEEGTSGSGGAPSIGEDEGENDSTQDEQDLDASMDDFDADPDTDQEHETEVDLDAEIEEEITAASEQVEEGETGEYEEEISEVLE